MSVSDATLVLKTLEGDKAAFGELYDRYAALIRAICYDVTRNVTGAQDLGQEVFLRAYVKLNKLADPESQLLGPSLEWTPRQFIDSVLARIALAAADGREP